MKRQRFIFCTLLLFLLGNLPLLPVSAEEAGDVAAKRILNLTVRTCEEDGSIPLANMIFDIYKTDGVNLPVGDKTAEASQEQVGTYKRRSNLAATVMTDENGNASIDFAKAGLPQGIYLVIQQENPAAGVIAPFFAAVADGETSLPLETVPEKAPDIRCDISALNQKSGSFDLGQPHRWIIRCDIPAGIGNAKQFFVTDILDYRLTYVPGSVTVQLYARDGSRSQLQRELHYTLQEEITDDGKEAVRVSLTPEGMSYIAANLRTGEEKCEIWVSLQSVLNSNAAMGATVPNDAHLEYINSAGIGYEADSDIPEVHMGGINLRKTDENGAPLAGTVFMIAREASQAEMEDETKIKEVLQVNGRDMAVVYVPFCTKDMQGEKTDQAITDEGGCASIYGLSYGTYYLVEIQASAGFSLAAEPITVTVDEASHLTKEDGWKNAEDMVVDHTLVIVNARHRLPDTGGMGTGIFTVAGLLIIAAACLLMLSNRKRYR